MRLAGRRVCHLCEEAVRSRERSCSTWMLNPRESSCSGAADPDRHHMASEMHPPSSTDSPWPAETAATLGHHD